MKKATAIIGALILVIGTMAFQTINEPKTYKLELTPQETEIVFQALGELPAKTTEGIRAKIYQQVQQQNQNKEQK